MVGDYTLSTGDLALIDPRCGDPDRLGFAVLLYYQEFPGQTLRQHEQPPADGPIHESPQIRLLLPPNGIHSKCLISARYDYTWRSSARRHAGPCYRLFGAGTGKRQVATRLSFK